MVNFDEIKARIVAIGPGSGDIFTCVQDSRLFTEWMDGRWCVTVDVTEDGLAFFHALERETDREVYSDLDLKNEADWVCLAKLVALEA